MAEAGIGKKLARIGLNDTYAHGGSLPYLKKKYGLDAMALIAGIEALTGETFVVPENELAAVYLAPVHSAAKAEAL